MTQWSGVHQAPTQRCKKYHRSCPINTLWSESACWGKIMPPRVETLSESISVWRAVLGAAGICWVAEAHALARRAFVLAFNCGPTLEGANHSETPVRACWYARMWQAGTAGPKLRAVLFCGCQKHAGGHTHTRNNKNTQWGRWRQNTVCPKQVWTFTGWAVLTVERGMGRILAAWDEYVWIY